MRTEPPHPASSRRFDPIRGERSRCHASENGNAGVRFRGRRHRPSGPSTCLARRRPAACTEPAAPTAGGHHPSPRPVLSPEPHTRQHQPLVRSVGVQGTRFPTKDGAPAFWEPRGSRRTSTPSTGSLLSESTTVTTMCPAEIGLHRTVSFRAVISRSRRARRMADLVACYLVRRGCLKSVPPTQHPSRQDRDAPEIRAMRIGGRHQSFCLR